MRQRVNCSDLSNLARAGQLQQRLGDAEVLAHVRQCGACEALYGPGNVGSLLAHGADAHFDFDVAAMRGDLEQLLQAESRDPAARVRGMPTRLRMLGVMGAVLLTACVVAATWLRGNWHSYPDTRMWVTLGSLAAVLGIAVRQLFRPLTSIEKPGYELSALLGALLLPVVLALVPHEEAVLTSPASPIVAAGKCLLLGLALGFPSAVFLLLGLRAPITEALGSDLRSLWLSAGVMGLVGNLVLQVHCALTASDHLLFGHATVSLAWLGVLWAWSRWAWSRRTSSRRPRRA
jgi:hypothetical protein